MPSKATADYDYEAVSISAWQIFLVGLLLRSLVSLHPYSGQANPPMFGDYEAQRHFMEVTLHLPINEWYRYDLQYWGLDYPPLTAFHSALMGYISNIIEPRWVQLDKSRGWESYEHNLFMRWSVLASDLLVYFSAVWATIEWLTPANINGSSAARYPLLIALIAYPGFILIDHGHFQYNCIMLGLALWAVVLIGRGWIIGGSIAFCLSIGFKQMALYYSLAFFSYLLGLVLFSPWRWRRRLVLFTMLSASVLLTFGVQLLPFYLADGWSGVWQVLVRLFPFNRGLFEDKVGNFWCAASPLLKLLRNRMPGLHDNLLLRLSTAITLLSCLPSCYMLMMAHRCNTRTNQHTDLRKSLIMLLIYGLAQISLSFFLFSFQVHEKSILLPAMPIMLLASLTSTSASSSQKPAPAGDCRWQEEWFVEWFGYLSMFSMYPLVKKDGLRLAYCSLIVLWNCLLWFARDGRSASPMPNIKSPIVRWIFGSGSLLFMAAVHAVDALLTPPQHLPDLFTMLNVWVSAGYFLLADIYLLYRLHQCYNGHANFDVSFGVGGEKKNI